VVNVVTRLLIASKGREKKTKRLDLFMKLTFSQKAQCQLKLASNATTRVIAKGSVNILISVGNQAKIELKNTLYALDFDLRRSWTRILKLFLRRTEHSSKIVVDESR
jgi:hypothetical protein